MSYSFTKTALDKDDLKSKVAAEFDVVVTHQPRHAADKDAAIAAANAFIDMVADPAEGYQLVISMHGSVSWTHDSGEQHTGAGLGISVHHGMIPTGS